MKKTKEIISDKVAVVNQILPHTNKWAWDLFIDGAANNWMPTEISMAKDIEQWRSDSLTNDEKLVVKRSLGFFAGSESLVANNLLLSIFKYVTDPECRQYILRQAYEESLHNLTVVYCCDSPAAAAGRCSQKGGLSRLSLPFWLREVGLRSW